MKLLRLYLYFKKVPFEYLKPDNKFDEMRYVVCYEYDIKKKILSNFGKRASSICVISRFKNSKYHIFYDFNIIKNIYEKEIMLDNIKDVYEKIIKNKYITKKDLKHFEDKKKEELFIERIK